MARQTCSCSSIFFLILTVVFVLLAAFTVPAEGSRSVRVAAEPNLPMANVNEKGEGEGFFMDITRYVADREGWNLTYISCNWDRCLSMLKKGEIDLLAAAAYTEKRARYADFTASVTASNWGRVYAPRGKSIDSFMQLEGKRLVAVRNDVHNLALRDMLAGFGVRPVLIETDNYEDVFRQLDDGWADAGVVSRFFGLLHEKKYDLNPTNLIFNPIELRFAVPKGRNGDLVAALDRNIEALKADNNSLYYQSLKKWTGFLREKAYPGWIRWVVFSIIVVAFLVIAHNLILRVRVSNRTALLEREVSERAQAQEALRAEKDRQLALTGNAPFGMVMIAGDGRYKYVNPKFTEIFGYGIEDVPDGRTWFRKAYPDPRTRHEAISKWLKMLEKFRPGENESYENRVTCADGTRKTVNFRPVWLDNGEILVASQDVTERRQAEEELAVYRGHLEELVRKRTAELEVAREKAESADHLKSAFLATMSHELRTPLNSIIGFTGLLIQGLAGPLNDEQLKQLGMVQNSSRHLLELINDVLDISKIEAGQLDIISEPFDLAGSIEKVTGLVSPLAEKKGLAVRLEKQAGIGMFTGDKRRVEQVVINLLNNAIKFTDKGFVELSCSANGPDIVISVRDTGIGIKPEDMERIFKPFQQIDTGLSRRHEGTGLGLSITRKLIDMMGGKILVQSEVGKGSTFTVILPASGKEAL